MPLHDKLTGLRFFLLRVTWEKPVGDTGAAVEADPVAAFLLVPIPVAFAKFCHAVAAAHEQLLLTRSCCSRCLGSSSSVEAASEHVRCLLEPLAHNCCCLGLLARLCLLCHPTGALACIIAAGILAVLGWGSSCAGVDLVAEGARFGSLLER